MMPHQAVSQPDGHAAPSVASQVHEEVAAVLEEGTQAGAEVVHALVVVLSDWFGFGLLLACFVCVAALVWVALEDRAKGAR
ncbi:MAG: hypothetical protein EB027_06080 [Actinobacteria bacterium]|nr:hypothetical protein [Actinomycetota bacterium]